MVTLTTTEFRGAVSETITRVAYRGERVILARNGKPVAAMVSAEDLQLLEELENAADLKAARAALKEPGRTPWRQAKKELGL